MAYRTLSDALNQTQDQLLAGLVKKYLTTNEYLAWAEPVITDRPYIKFNRVVDYGAVQKGIDCNTSFASEAISAAPVTVSLVKYGRQFEVCEDVENLAGTFVMQTQEELLGAMTALSNELATDAIDGNGSGEIHGLNSLVTSSVPASGVGGVGNIEALWYLEDAVKAKSGKMAYICNSTTKRKIMRVISDNSQIPYTDLQNGLFTVPLFNGKPILVNDTCTTGDVFLINGDNAEGVFPVIGQNSGQNIGGLFGMKDIGYSQTKDTRLFRLTGNFGHIAKSTQALARITGF